MKNMFKTKRTLIFICLLLFITPLFAASDYFAPFGSNPLFEQMVTDIYNDEDYSTVMASYNNYASEKLSAIERDRAEYLIVRYLKDNDYTEEAKEHLKVEKEILEDIEAGLYYDIAKMNYTSSSYYVTGNMGTGLENSNLAKANQKKYPEDYYVLLTNARRLIFTPQIAGGSNSNALKILEPLLKEEDNLNILDRYSLYGALAAAHYNKGHYSEAKNYIDKAPSIFSGEPYIVKLKEKINKKVK